MDVATIAAAQIGAQMSLAQNSVAISMLKQTQEQQQGLVAMLAQQSQQAAAPTGTGVLLNATA